MRRSVLVLLATTSSLGLLACNNAALWHWPVHFSGMELSTGVPIYLWDDDEVLPVPIEDMERQAEAVRQYWANYCDGFDCLPVEESLVSVMLKKTCPLEVLDSGLWVVGTYRQDTAEIVMCVRVDRLWAHGTFIHELFHHYEDWVPYLGGKCLTPSCESDPEHEGEYWDDVLAVAEQAEEQ